MSESFSYDSVPYSSYTFPKTFPDRLATMASLYGMATADPASCRVLELGCGDGTNLLAMAYTMPESRFTGIDLSQFHIEKARRSAEWLGANNVRLDRADISDIDPKELGEFDFIVAHGLFSWVPKNVRNAILHIYSGCLAPNGVGYISYNVFPGGHVRRMVSDIMRFCTDNETDPSVRVQKARKIAAFVADSAVSGSPYKAILQNEVQRLAVRDDQNLFHDDLAAINEPFYFHEFVELLEEWNLRYFADADPEPAIENTLSPEGSTLLDTFAIGSKTRREQFVDFIRGQRFRCSLFCRNDIRPLDDISIEAIDDLLISTGLEHDQNSITEVSRFARPDGHTIELNHPLTIAVLKYVRSEAPRGVPFREALDNVFGGDVIDPEDVTVCRRYLIDLFEVELINLHRFQPSFVLGVTARPEVSHFARLQIELGCRVVTTMPGSNIEIGSPALRLLVSLLDGRRDRAELIAAMTERIEVPDGEEKALRQRLPQMIESNLQKMCELGLLIG